MRLSARTSVLLCAAGALALAAFAVPAARAVPLCGASDPCPARPPSLVRAEFGRDLIDDALAHSLAQNAGRPGLDAGKVMTSDDAEIDPASRVPPGLAFLMSAVLPGSGQLMERRNRAFAYLGMEALAWIGHLSWKDAGNKKEGEYEAFARRNWELETWKSRASGAVDSCQAAMPPGSNYAEELQRLEELFAQQDLDTFYEDLGKDEVYRSGWRDYTCSLPATKSPLRREFQDMRDDRNAFLTRARYALTFAFLNRVVSAVDAYRTAKGAQLPLGDRTRLELQMKGSVRSPRAVLRIRRTF